MVYSPLRYHKVIQILNKLHKYDPTMDSTCTNACVVINRSLNALFPTIRHYIAQAHWTIHVMKVFKQLLWRSNRDGQTHVIWDGYGNSPHHSLVGCRWAGQLLISRAPSAVISDPDWLIMMGCESPSFMNKMSLWTLNSALQLGIGVNYRCSRHGLGPVLGCT